MSWTQQALIFLVVAGFALLTWRLVRPRLQLVVTERGILDRRLRLGWIRWEEIEGAYQPTARDSDALRLRLRVTERLGRRLRRASGVPATPGAQSLDVRLDLSGSEISAVELLQQILSRTGRQPR